MMGQKAASAILFLLLFAGLAAAQTANATDSSAVIALDGSTKVMSTDWGVDGVNITFKSKVPRIATIVDTNSISSSGASQVSFKQTKISTGRTTVYMPLESDQGSKTATISVGDNLIAISNPQQPFLKSIVKVDAYLIPWLVAIETTAFIFAIIGWRKYKWSREMRRVS